MPLDAVMGLTVFLDQRKSSAATNSATAICDMTSATNIFDPLTS